MNENIKINNRKHKMNIFRSLMSVEFHTSGPKTREEIWAELEQLERNGKLKIYRPTKER